MSYKTHPLEIPEIVRLVGRYLDKATEIAALAVSPTFRSQISATAWNRIVVDFGNKALYNDTPSYTDRFKGGPRLLPWESLESYGSHVRTITLTSGFCRRPPASYSRPASFADLLTMIGKLMGLQCMTLDISRVEGNDLSRLFKICSRLKVLYIFNCGMSKKRTINRNWELQALAHKSTYDLEELLLSSTCGIGLSGFLSRSPRLTVLRISDQSNSDPGGYFEEQFMNDLVESFKTEGIMPRLQHLDLRIGKLNSNAIPKVLKSVRCLRSFECHRQDVLWSIDNFRPHFSTVTTIDVQCGTPEFWQGVMLWFPSLVEAKEVVLSAEDIIGGDIWASTRIESLDLNVLVGSEGNVGSNREAQEHALFQRIAKLEKLKKLSVHTGWHDERTLLAESWGVLLGIETLRSVELGYELTADQDTLNVLRRFSEKQMRLEWSEAKMSLSSQVADSVATDDALLLQAYNAFHAANQN